MKLYWLLVFALFAVAAPAIAADRIDVFEVRDVAVDVTAETAAAARVKALAEGERQAFERLLRRLTLARDHPRIPRHEQSDIAEYVKDFSVSEEKTSAVRYLATLSYRFRRQSVRELLDAFNLPFSETLSKPVLVLPVYQAAGALVLWDDPNPWRAAWSFPEKMDGLVPLVEPRGDLNDVGTIGPELAIKGDRARIAAVARRYGVQDVIVAYALLRLDAAVARNRVEVYVSRYGDEGSPEPELLNYRQDEGESVEALLDRAARAVAGHIEDQWKQRNLLRLDRQNVAAVAVPITGLRDWLAVRKRLKNVPLIHEAEMVLLSLDEVRVNLHYVGDPEQLRVGLGQADLTLVKEEDEWVLYLAEVLPAEKT